MVAMTALSDERNVYEELARSRKAARLALRLVTWLHAGRVHRSTLDDAMTAEMWAELMDQCNVKTASRTTRALVLDMVKGEIER